MKCKFIQIIKKYFFLILYYGFAYYLPPTNANVFGKWGGAIRNWCFRNIAKKAGNPINIESHAHFGNGSEIELGNHSCIGIHCYVPNDIKIGDHVMMGPHCYIMQNYTHKHDRVDIPIGWQGMERIKRRTEIGDDVWLGRQVLMMAGKHIGNHSIIAAGAVVCKDVPDYVIAGGNPIKVIKERR